mmetsp:Transcript_98409/g.317272  ORF Transcript_98409/g.317272 Transcript_98409/m.317272 type:complete len:233 (-) Transcript_98409:345-1043(-)
MSVRPSVFQSSTGCSGCGGVGQLGNVNHTAAYVPFVRHTFLAVSPVQLAPPTKPRARSQPEMGTCDHYAREVHVLMFKQRSSQHKEVDGAPPEHGTRDEVPGPTPMTRTASAALLSSDVGDAEEPLESVFARVPRDDDGRPTSIGSLRHALGDCRPCAYIGSSQRPCLNNVRCLFCHLPHSPKRRVRLCRRKRLEMRAAVEAAIANAGAEGLSRPPRYVPISWCGPAAGGSL